ncbi:hypothetical protein NECAME_17347 [Necator americanus]|uniref:Serpin domain-containing protein n=1 Tax=Necator americanus TaxID=51031 RepID=W2TRY6_NECAM|nr:hypothetical protein NECAME_17347 [Necator americanus]ETN83762.1 hypothetical protein NECAME_17347 [Necator americanus]
MPLSRNPGTSDSTFLIAETDFGLNMMRQAPATESLVVSPISVIFALGMIQLGAKGKTKTQINQLISKESSDTDIINYYSNLSSQIQNATNGVSTRIANGFFLNKQFAISDQYRGDIAKKYAALIQSVDFTNQQQAAEITFMNDFGVYRLYTEDQDVQVLSLSYKDPSYAFNIFLPKQK